MNTLHSILLVILAVLPGAFIVYKVYKQDKIEKEPKALLGMLLLGGVASTIPVGILEDILEKKILGLIFSKSTPLYAFFDAFLVAALVEETAKYLILKKITWKNPAFNYTFDAIVYAMCVGMGFAILENILYVLMEGWEVAILRAVTSIPGHAVYAVYMGYYYGRAKLCDTEHYTQGTRSNLLKALVVPLWLHGFYDFCLIINNNMFFWIFIVFINVLFRNTYKNINKFSADDTSIK